MFKEFKEFISRGSVVELAVGVVIGAAFTSVVNALVEGLITPVISLVGERDYTELEFTVYGSTFRYGLVITATLSFLMVAAAVFFFVVKPLNVLEARKRRGEVEEEAVADEVLLLIEIRDLLRERQDVR